MEYEGTTVEVVGSGIAIKGGISNIPPTPGTNGSVDESLPPSELPALPSAADGTGAGAAGVDLEGFLLDFFLGFLPLDIIPPIPPPPARQQQHKQRRAIHSQIGNCDPEEPDAAEPELAADPEESLAQDP